MSRLERPLKHVMQLSVATVPAGAALILLDMITVSFAEQSLVGFVGEGVMGAGYGGFLATVAALRKCLFGINTEELPDVERLDEYESSFSNEDCRSRFADFKKLLERFYTNNKHILTTREKTLRLLGLIVAGAGIVTLFVSDSSTGGAVSALLAILGIVPYGDAISELKNYLKGCEEAREECSELSSKWEELKQDCLETRYRHI